MKPTLLLLALLPAAVTAVGQQQTPIELRSGLVITSSVSVLPRTYRLAAPASMDSAAITIRGENITVDFAGAVLRGDEEHSDPDLDSGVAVRIDGGRNIRILHAHIRGYRIAILARGTQGLDLVDNDVSYNWKPRLFSLTEHESLVDWLSFHHNEKDEWLRYGAGFYLASVIGGEIRNNRCVQGMNGLLMTRSDRLRISGNNFSFNSGLGIGLYRSSENSIIYNRLDYDVRGYSHRFYHRGQDSADLLFFEQSSHNVVAYNSATHGGDGFFLWAGQSTMDSGSGGANDNLLYGNDFSFSPANGIEATFSRNTFVRNRVEGCDYGVWGGYSFESKIVGNRFRGNRFGVAIEHGQDNLIASNRFEGDTTGVSLWAMPIEPSDWGYPKHRDTRSRDCRIENNVFDGNRFGVKAANTSGLSVVNNLWSNVDTVFALRDTSNVRVERDLAAGPATPQFPDLPQEYAAMAPPGIAPGDTGVPGSDAARMDRSAIIIDEWGPYDYHSPKLWPVDSAHELPLRLRTLGPPGLWKVSGERGIGRISAIHGVIGDTVAVTPRPDSTGDWELTLEYQGSATTSPRGEEHSAGRPYRFSFERFEPATDWSVRFFAWGDSADPRTRPEMFNALLNTPPILEQRTPRLDYEWYRPKFHELPQERFALEASGTVNLSTGTYTLRTISDDGVRVWVDGALVINNWSQHGSTLDYSTISGGRHTLRVQYFQVDGWVEFRLDILRGMQRSPGSPG